MTEKEPAWWMLYLAIGLIGTVAIAKIVVPFFEDDLKNGTPRVHFYSQEAWENCEGMFGEAKRRGASHWTCHDPSIFVNQ